MLLAGWMATLPAWGQETGRKDGWYHVTEGKNDSLEAMPFIGLDDIAALQPDKDGNGRYVILGQVKEEKTDTWADETEKAIGRKIAFVFNDSVLTAPMVNARIASGRFLITGPDSKGLEAIYRRIMQKMEPSQIDLAREDSLRRATEQRLWQEARQYRATLTDTTYLDTRGPMSLAALDAWTGNGFNPDYAFNQVVYLAALERAQKRLTPKDGQLMPAFGSARDLHISEGLYRFILDTLKQWNGMLESGKFEIVEVGGCYAVAPKKRDGAAE